jgi:hypothetical protein
MKRISLALLLLVGGVALAQPVPVTSGELLDAKATIDKTGIRFKKWDKDDAYFKIESKLTSDLKKAQGKKEFTQEDADIKLKVYDIPKGVEYEYILKKKPLVNQFVLDLEFTDLVFFYQPPLTQAEIDEGAIRPENVIGSYAVYHATKKHYEIGETNYKAGKAFHIYRPKAIDDNGIEQWCEYNTDVQETAQLVITCPQSWLDTAKYPVIIDPTVGDTDGGASCDTQLYLFGTIYTLSDNAVVTAIDASVFENVAGSHDYRGAIWDDNAGTPNNRLALGTAIQMNTGSCPNENYVTSPVASASVNAQDIWIGGSHSENFPGNNISCNYDNGNNGYEYGAGAAYPPPDPFPAGSARANRQYSVFATYTIAGAAIPQAPVIIF